MTRRSPLIRHRFGMCQTVLASASDVMSRNVKTASPKRLTNEDIIEATKTNKRALLIDCLIYYVLLCTGLCLLN